MLAAGLAIGGLGLLAGIGLAVASKVFYVYVDPLIIEVEEALPGANCGGCGLPGCSSAAQAIVVGQLAPNACVGGGPSSLTVAGGPSSSLITEPRSGTSASGGRWILSCG